MYNALFFFDFLFNRIVPNLYISNAGLGTGKRAKYLTNKYLAFSFTKTFPTSGVNGDQRKNLRDSSSGIIFSQSEEKESSIDFIACSPIEYKYISLPLPA